MQTTPIDRVDPPLAAPERAMLTAFLDYHRATLLWKVDGVDDADLRRPLTPSGMSLLGLVKHLAYVEQWWFLMVFAGEDLPAPWTDADPDADWRVEDDETTAAILDFYRSTVERARRRCGSRPRRTRAPVRQGADVALDHGPYDRGDCPSQWARRPHARGHRRRHRRVAVPLRLLRSPISS